MFEKVRVKYQNGDIVTDEGPWFDTVLEATNDRIEKLQAQLPAAQQEVEAAIRLGDPYRGAGVAELHRLLGELNSARCQKAASERMSKLRGVANGQ